MHKPLKLAALAVTMLAASVSTNSALAEGALSANIGFASDYVYRGIYQADSSASAGVDYSNSGAYVGTWLADVDLGLEYDLYAGYGGEMSGVSYDINYTGYNYTRDDPNEVGGAFDDTYQEANLTVGYGPVSLGYASGTYDNFEGKIAGNKKLDYSVATLTAEYKGFTFVYGDYGMDFEGSWFELGYGTEIGGFDTGLNLIVSGDKLDNQEYMVFTLGKTFDL
jgi:uncharacterized protein (TIGR02001 family)